MSASIAEASGAAPLAALTSGAPRQLQVVGVDPNTAMAQYAAQVGEGLCLAVSGCDLHGWCACGCACACGVCLDAGPGTDMGPVCLSQVELVYILSYGSKPRAPRYCKPTIFSYAIHWVLGTGCDGCARSRLLLLGCGWWMLLVLLSKAAQPQVVSAVHSTHAGGAWQLGGLQ